MNNEDAKASHLPQEYLGDGVYARWDGVHVILDIRGQGEDWDSIALDPNVRRNLERFTKRCETGQYDLVSQG